MIDIRLNMFYLQNGPEGPGWYLAGTRFIEDRCEEIIPRVRLTAGEAEKFATVTDNFARGKPLNWTPNFIRVDTNLRNAIHEANEMAREELEGHIAWLQSQHDKLDILKARIAEFDPPDKD